MEICVFTKHFQNRSPEELGKLMQELGVAGVDLTVRPGGYIEPATVRKALPQLQKILAQYRVKISMLTTTITNSTSPYADEIVETASKLNIPYIKLGYWHYRGFGHYYEQEKQVRNDLKSLEGLFRQNGVKAGFHIHSHDSMGLNGAYAWRLIENCDPEVVGIYYDIGHSVMEGSITGWIMDLDLIAKRIFMIAIKNLAWYQMGNQDDLQNGWLFRMVPLERGLADIPTFIKILKKIPYEGLFSFHSEYQGRYSWRVLNDEELVIQTKKDIDYFKKWWQKISPQTPIEYSFLKE
jgi:sugar phosphate isomerase/epimerase